jgi:cell division protein FtsZ
VVVGTTIDLEMRNELRVTIVATGLGQGVPAKQTSQRDRDVVIPHVKLMQQRSERLSVNEGEAHTRYERGSRQKAVGDGLGERADSDLEYLDIPAFLRRQAE